jgi:hypothetical protein
LLLWFRKVAPSGWLLYGRLFLFVSAVTYSTLPILAIVAIYSLRFLHGCVAKAYEACRNFVGASGVLQANADGILRIPVASLGPPNGAMRFVMDYLARPVHKTEKDRNFLDI